MINDIELGLWFHHNCKCYREGRIAKSKRILLEKANFSLLTEKENIWIENYNIYKNYVEKFNTIYVPPLTEYEGIRLDKWTKSVRASYHGNILSKEHFELLSKIGFIFDNPHKYLKDSLWLQHFDFLKNFFEETGSNFIPAMLKDDSGIFLCSWAQAQRHKNRKGKLEFEKKELLESINFPFNEEKNSSSLEESILFYYIQKLFPNAKQRDNSHDFELDIYVEYNNIKIGCEFDGSFYHKNSFNRDFMKAKKCEENKIILFDVRFKSCGSLQKNNKYYYEYLLTQSKNYIYITKEFENIIKKIIFDMCEILHLNPETDIDIERDIREISKLKADHLKSQWFNSYHQVKKLFIENGCILHNKNENKKLYNWLTTQKQAYQKGILSKERICLIEKLIPYGFSWTDINSWENKYKVYCEYVNTYGEIRKFPFRFKYNGVDLQSWEHKNRLDYTTGKLSNDKIKLLQDMGFNFTEPDAWEEKYFLYKEYCKKYDVKNIERNVIYKDIQLGGWVSEQRKKKKNGSLPQYRIDKLNEVGFVWKVRKDSDEIWTNNYNLLVQYYEKNNHVNVKYNEVYNDFNMGNWVSKQRSAYHKGTLSPDRIEKLEAIGFLWESPNKRKAS